MAVILRRPRCPEPLSGTRTDDRAFAIDGEWNVLLAEQGAYAGAVDRPNSCPCGLTLLQGDDGTPAVTLDATVPCGP